MISDGAISTQRRELRARGFASCITVRQIYDWHDRPRTARLNVFVKKAGVAEGREVVAVGRELEEEDLREAAAEAVSRWQTKSARLSEQLAAASTDHA